MFNIVDYPPAFGECSLCQKHTCGTKEDGTQSWLHSPIELNVGGDLTIGYQCAKLIMNGFGLTVEFVEHEIFLTPTDEQIGDYIRKFSSYVIPENIQDGSPYEHSVEQMNRDQLKLYLKMRKVDFVPQWGEERLREEALKHV